MPIPDPVNIEMFRGDTRTINFAATVDGSAVNLTGASLWMTAKYAKGDPDDKAVFQLEIGNGITVTDLAGGLYKARIGPTETQGIIQDADLYWDTQIKDSSSEVYTLAHGRLKVFVDVTRSTS